MFKAEAQKQNKKSDKCEKKKGFGFDSIDQDVEHILKKFMSQIMSGHGLVAYKVMEMALQKRQRSKSFFEQLFTKENKSCVDASKKLKGSLKRDGTADNRLIRESVFQFLGRDEKANTKTRQQFVKSLLNYYDQDSDSLQVPRALACLAFLRHWVVRGECGDLSVQSTEMLH